MKNDWKHEVNWYSVTVRNNLHNSPSHKYAFDRALQIHQHDRAREGFGEREVMFFGKPSEHIKEISWRS